MIINKKMKQNKHIVLSLAMFIVFCNTCLGNQNIQLTNTIGKPESEKGLFVNTNNGNSISTGQHDVLKQTPTMSRSFSDSTKKAFEINKYTVENEKLKVWIQNADNIPMVDIICYNILGKKVKEIGRISIDANEFEFTPYECYVNDIPNGIYIISFQGNNIRAAIKITISR